MTDQFSDIKISISDIGARVESMSKGGTKTTKLISLIDLASVFSSNALFDTGLLPTNDGICFLGQKSNTELVVFTRPPQVRGVKYRRGSSEQQDFQVHVPRMYMFMNFVKDGNKKTLKSSKLFTAAVPIRRKQDVLSVFPFCNVFDGGDICWGQNVIQPITSLLGCEAIYELFWTAPFNGDLGYRGPRLLVDVDNKCISSETVTRPGLESINDTLSYFKYANDFKFEFNPYWLRTTSSFEQIVALMIGTS